MKFYHVSLNLDHVQQEFIPRIPNTRMEYENSEIPRICVSKSIEGALSAFPDGGLYLENLFEDGFLVIRIYEFEAKKEDIIDCKYLYEHSLVNDANLTQECWITKKCIPSSIYDIKIIAFNDKIQDLLTYPELQAIEKGADYEEVWKGGVLTLISDVEYVKINIIK